MSVKLILEAKLISNCLNSNCFLPRAPFVSDAYMYDWTAETWTQLASMFTPRDAWRSCGVATVANGDKEVVMITGPGADSTPSEIYSVSSDTWRAGPYFPEEANYMSAVQDGRGSFLVLGGFVDNLATPGLSEDIDTVYRFDEDTEEFVLMEARLPVGVRVPTGLFVSIDMV